MAEYISRDEVLEHSEYTGNFNLVVPVRFIRAIKAADVQPIRHGRWTYPYKDKDINQCSECRSCVQDKISNVREMFAYCPFCGARMDLMDGDSNE